MRFFFFAAMAGAVVILSFYNIIDGENSDL